MDLEFDKAASRLKNEQRARAEKERQRREREKKMKDEADRKNAELEGIAKERRAELAEKQAEEDERLRLEREHIELTTGGIDWCDVFRAVPLSRPELSEGDRVTLPVSALNGLQFKGAMELKRLLTFELTTPQGGRTHCGVIEFVAEDGTIGLPRKVQTSLGAITDADDTLEGGFATRVTARFLLLPKGTFVRLQPHSAGFSESVAAMRGASVPVFDTARSKWVLPGLEGVLHASLQPLSCLTVGDTVTVEHNGRHFDMSVLQVEPSYAGNAVALIDTDIQVELVALIDTDIQVESAPSKAEEEALERQAREQEEAAAASARERAANEAASHSRQARLQERRASARRRHELTEEPAAGEGVMTLSIRLPEGARVVRRMACAASLQELLDYADVCLASGEKDFCLATTFPRRVLRREEAGVTLEQLGLSVPQESLVLEYTQD